ncbi:beta-lactamase/transpeptidase-like protein [Macrophomina phaseolina]|uniref:Beta-lactamase/transpeptidase-like protein n=1 Tax=Macrophomina phaseolina TaxID=35725 RepID=A0ABQ8GQX8_9PEZI|nr:beta-lactamase/transpeptidase-like protein [Macrophomina phaseolina]
MQTAAESVERILDTVPDRYRGPGGCVAILKDGALVGQRAWGFANLDARIAMTPRTVLPICSITKQLLCQAILDLERHPPPGPPASPAAVRAQLAAHAAAPADGGIALDHLTDMHSGLRDYWALCTLWGSRPDTPFSVAAHAPLALARAGAALHFPPGAAMSYCNTNFHVLGAAASAVAGRPLGAVLEERVFARAGMASARLRADTAASLEPGGGEGCVGYEGDEARGFVEASNAIEWEGDAGVVAALEDMVAYERWFDGVWSDEPGGAWYRDAAAPRAYADGGRARYRLGLSHTEVRGVPTVGHGGALRGFRLHRRYVPSERLSVVVLFNHEASAEGCAAYLIAEVLGLPAAPPADDTIEPTQEWFGVFLDEASQLAVTVKPAGKAKVSISYTGDSEAVPLVDATNARSRRMVAQVERDVLRVHCLDDNLKIQARRVLKQDARLKSFSLPAKFRCEALDSTFHCSGHGSLLYGAFDGFLGEGPPHLMRHLGGDVWLLADPRGMDAPAPGDWTVVFRRDQQDTVVGATIGCWLARKLEYVKA